MIKRYVLQLASIMNCKPREVLHLLTREQIVLLIYEAMTREPYASYEVFE